MIGVWHLLNYQSSRFLLAFSLYIRYGLKLAFISGRHGLFFGGLLAGLSPSLNVAHLVLAGESLLNVVLPSKPASVRRCLMRHPI